MVFADPPPPGSGRKIQEYLFRQTGGVRCCWLEKKCLLAVLLPGPSRFPLAHSTPGFSFDCIVSSTVLLMGTMSLPTVGACGLCPCWWKGALSCRCVFPNPGFSFDSNVSLNCCFFVVKWFFYQAPLACLNGHSIPRLETSHRQKRPTGRPGWVRIPHRKAPQDWFGKTKKASPETHLRCLDMVWSTPPHRQDGKKCVLFIIIIIFYDYFGFHFFWGLSRVENKQLPTTISSSFLTKYTQVFSVI